MTPPPIEGAPTAPAVARNREPILAVLRQALPAQGTVLEIASGTGEHAVHFAAALPHLTWQPTDADTDALRASRPIVRSAQLPNLLSPLVLDAASPVWPVTHADAVVAINMIHISPWRSTEGLMEGAARVLPPVLRSISMEHSRRAIAIPRRATPPSTRICGRAIRNGACATSSRSPTSPAGTGCISSSASRCRPTT